MRIGLIAMSGVRVENEELKRAGLMLPGFVERSEVIASLPSLGLLTLAALTPREHEVTYHEIRDLKTDAIPGGEFDLVAISTMTAQALEAYEVAARFRAMGVPVVMGGLHATAATDDVVSRGIPVVAGEGEDVWARVVEDAARARMEAVYRSGAPFDLARAPMPRFDLLDVAKYNRLTVQTARGCPHKCEFCASSILLTPGYSVKPVDMVIAEIRAIKAMWARPFIEFADDNSFAQRGHAKELLCALIPERVKWFTEADISIAKDPEMLELMRAAGCRQVLIGLESPVEAGLDRLELRANWKLRQMPVYEEAVRTIQRHGISVIGCFILGLDGHTPAVFDAVHAFVARTNLYDVQITVQTPFPGTPLYERLGRAGRLTHPGQWNRCTLFDVNYEPMGMTARELERGMVDLTKRLYDPGFIRTRRAAFHREWRSAARERRERRAG
jgi:radical SAM superfamily enzyme YgiQ (UPF0313 family)